eukprot:13579179-Alexandrium_andersonii.AAC.1
MQIRAPEAPREARRLRPPPLGSVSEFLQTLSRGGGRLAHWASWDRDLPGWISGAPVMFDQRAK